jgi:hypothetical protein
MKTNKLVHQIQYRILSPQILNFNKTKNPLVIKKPIILEIFCLKFCVIFYSEDWTFFSCVKTCKVSPRVVTFYVLVFTFHSGPMKLVWDIGVWTVIGIFLPPFSWLWLLCRYCKILGSLSLVSIQKLDSRSITLVVWDVVRKMPRQRTC